MIKIVKLYLFNFYVFLIDLFTAIYRDLVGIFLVVTLEIRIHLIVKRGMVLADLFRKQLRKSPLKPCILFNDETWTFQDLEDYSNKIANLFQNKFKLKKGDCVALFVENKPEYVGIWLGLSKIGVVSALVNTNLKTQSLIHSINIAQPKLVIYSSTLEDAFDTARNEINKEIQSIVEGSIVGESSSNKSTKTLNLNELLKSTSSEIVQPIEKVKPNDVALYIYTSGTTGLPKPALIKQSRLCAAGFVFFESAFLNRNDIVYLPLPLYHANGGMIGIGATLVSGATVVLRNKFSVTNFWKDCIKYKCTAFMYVGEICRYLVNQPASPLDTQHTIKKAIGNGLRENVWKDFYRRFNVKCVEFYAASEGNCILGACGFAPLINRFVRALPVEIIKIDNAMNPIRDKNGLCIKCKPGEKGLMVGIIGNTAKTAFTGYANNPQASKKKIIENVFKKGQNAFNSGDMMLSDKWGYMYFCDRLGDTYRWRGENVATVEIENVISSYLNSTEVAVYGVEIPGQEGRAGMAAIVSSNVDLDRLAKYLIKNLPSYAKPLFIRLTKDLEHTGSHKITKTNLTEQAYNINLYNDKTYYFDTNEQTYKEITPKIYESIQNGNVKL